VKFCPSCKSQAHKIGADAGKKKSPGDRGFGKEMVAAWAYPFREDGPVIMLTGTVFFALAGVGQRFLFLLGGLVFVMTTGYWMAYAQKVVAASANGEEQPPTWPDFSDYLQDIIIPFLQAAGLFLIYLLPFFLVKFTLPADELRSAIISGAVLLIALFMMPMAWLAISLHESIAGLSPHFVIPSILRIPGQYFVIFLEIVALVAIHIGLETLLEKTRIPIVGTLVSSFLAIYFTIVVCRLLGILYFLNRERLAWFKIR
jgi:hypothetical protein